MYNFFWLFRLTWRFWPFSSSSYSLRMSSPVNGKFISSSKYRLMSRGSIVVAPVLNDCSNILRCSMYSARKSCAHGTNLMGFRSEFKFVELRKKTTLNWSVSRSLNPCKLMSAWFASYLLVPHIRTDIALPRPLIRIFTVKKALYFLGGMHHFPPPTR